VFALAILIMQLTLSLTLLTKRYVSWRYAHESKLQQLDET